MEQELQKDLRGADLRGANLRYADLVGADLRGADLVGADLRGADLGCANLTGANLADANLRGADLRGANLRYADLTGADLRCADLRGTDLSYADIRGADLTDACLVGVDVPGVVYDDFTADIVTVGRDRFFRWVAKTFGTGDEAKTIAASDEADPEDAAYHAGLKRRAEMLAEIAASDAKYITYGDGDLGIPVSKADALDDIASMDPLSIGDGTWYPCSGPVSDEAKEIVARGGYEAAVSLMDDGIRECLHAELAPCSDAAFLAAYMAAHKAAFGKDFVVA